MLNPIQTKTSLKILDAVPAFPKVIAEMVAGYTRTEDELLAIAKIPVKNIRMVEKFNAQTSWREKLYVTDDPDKSEALKCVLSSSTVDPRIKTNIIRSLIGSHSVYFNSSRQLVPVEVNSTNQVKYKVFNCLLNTMREESMVINLNRVNLSYLNLSGINFNHVMAVGANLDHAILSKTTLRYADLSATNLSGALIEGADAEGVVLRNANLAEASFSGSNLRFVDVTGARFDTTFISKSASESTDLTGIVTADKALIRFLSYFKGLLSNEIHVSGKVHLTSVLKKQNYQSCVIS